MITRLIHYLTDAIEIVLGLRFFLRFTGANSANGFVNFLYGFSEIFLAPFRGIFPRTIIDGALLEWSTLFAMAVYGIGAYLLVRLIVVLTNTEDEDTIESQQP